MRSHPGVTAKFFSALAAVGVNIKMISTSEIRISVVIDQDDVDRAVAAAHTAFGLDVVRGRGRVRGHRPLNRQCDKLSLRASSGRVQAFRFARSPRQRAHWVLVSRVYNFSAGPAILPEEVLQQAAEEMHDWHGSGQSVMEMSHRGKEFISIAEAAEADLRTLLAIPDHYRVLFLQGGATLQFEMVPMNLLRGKASSDYVHTGEWAKKAIKAAQGLRRGQSRRQRGGPQLHLRPRSGDLAPRRGRGVPALHRQRDHRRGRVLLRARDRGRSLGQRHVVQSLVPAGGRVEVRTDLRGRAEEHRPGRTDHRDHPRRPRSGSASRRRR